MWLAEKGGEVYRHPYDLGAYENLTFVRDSLFIFIWLIEDMVLTVEWLLCLLSFLTIILSMYLIQVSGNGTYLTGNISVLDNFSLSHLEQYYMVSSLASEGKVF